MSKEDSKRKIMTALPYFDLTPEKYLDTLTEFEIYFDHLIKKIERSIIDKNNSKAISVVSLIRGMAEDLSLEYTAIQCNLFEKLNKNKMVEDVLEILEQIIEVTKKELCDIRDNLEK